MRQQLELRIPALTRSDQAGDLGATLTGMSGVEDIQIDPAAHTVTVVFDDSLVQPALIKYGINGAGYPVAEQTLRETRT